MTTGGHPGQPPPQVHPPPFGGGGAGSGGGLKELTGPQRVAYNLALMTFGFITIVTVLLLVFWLWESPATPALLRNGVAPQARKTIENYKQLTSTITDNTTKLFDLVVVRAILPVFTAIVGYIFGRSQS